MTNKIGFRCKGKAEGARSPVVAPITQYIRSFIGLFLHDLQKSSVDVYELAGLANIKVLLPNATKFINQL